MKNTFKNSDEIGIAAGIGARSLVHYLRGRCAQITKNQILLNRFIISDDDLIAQYKQVAPKTKMSDDEILKHVKIKGVDE